MFGIDLRSITAHPFGYTPVCMVSASRGARHACTRLTNLVTISRRSETHTLPRRHSKTRTMPRAPTGRRRSYHAAPAHPQNFHPVDPQLVTNKNPAPRATHRSSGRVNILAANTLLAWQTTIYSVLAWPPTQLRPPFSSGHVQVLPTHRRPTPSVPSTTLRSRHPTTLAPPGS